MALGCSGEFHTVRPTEVQNLVRTDHFFWELGEVGKYGWNAEESTTLKRYGWQGQRWTSLSCVRK